MNQPTFERLLYTDCRPGEGLGGGGGYQTQAQSPNCKPHQSRAATSWLLYSVQTQWVNQGREPEDFPNGLAHASESGFGTSQSLYLGKEVNGSRQGNYLADCLLTETIESYGIIRPAQLWLAPFWRQHAWPTTECPAFDEGLDLGPLDHDALADWAKVSTDRRHGLERLLTILENPDGKRVAIRARTPEDALYWIATSTILLPMIRAAAVSFRVFTNNIDETPHRVVAVPADLHPNLTPATRPTMFVIDAETDDTDQIEVSARASFWVRHLLRAAEPYDVVEAIEMAARFGGHTEEEQSDSRVAAMALCDPEWEVEDAAALGRWIRHALTSEHSQSAQSLIDRLVKNQDVRLVDLRLVDQLASDGQVSVNVESTRMRLPSAEVAEADREIAPPPERLAPVRMTTANTTDATSELTSAMIVGTDRTVDCLLQVGWRHELAPSKPSPSLIQRLNDFAFSWLELSEPDSSSHRWILRDDLSDAVHAQLHHQFTTGGVGSIRTALPRAVELLSDRPIDVTDAFAWHIEACYTATLGPPERLNRVRKTVAFLSRTANAPQRMAYQHALAAWNALDAATAFHLVLSTAKRHQLDPDVVAVAIEGLKAQADNPDSETIGVIDELWNRRNLEGVPRLARMAQSGQTLSVLFQKTDRMAGTVDLSPVAGDLVGLRDLDQGVVALSMPEFARAAERFRGPGLGQAILLNLNEQNGVGFVRTWSSRLSTSQGSPQVAAWMVRWLRDKKLVTSVRQELEAQLLEVVTSGSRSTDDHWKSTVDRYLQSDAELDCWDQICRGEQVVRARGSRPWRRPS